LKMEMHWRSNPVGKVRKNLPFFKELAYEFLHKKLDTTYLKMHYLTAWEEKISTKRWM